LQQTGMVWISMIDVMNATSMGENKIVNKLA